MSMFSTGRLALERPVPIERMIWREPGEHFDAGDRRLVLPPISDGPLAMLRPMSTRLSDLLVEALVASGATTMFGLPGGGPNLDVIGAAIARDMTFVLAHGETEAAIMASTFGLLTRTPAAVVVTRGPGAASAANGIAQATLDRYPLVAITDTVPAAQARRVVHQRIDQRAFLGPISKCSATVSDASDPVELSALISTAHRWPFGAVHLDYDATGTPASTPPLERAPTWDGDLAAARSLLASASRPVIVVGAEAAFTAPGIGEVLAGFGCPVLTTYQAIGVVPTEGDLNAGLFTNGALERPVLEAADLIVTIGLDAVEPIPAPWDLAPPVLRISSVPQHDEYMPATVDLVGDLVEICSALRCRSTGWSPDAPRRFRDDARVRVRGARAGFGPIDVVETAMAHTTSRSTVTVDAGAHFLAIMPLWPVAEPMRLLISNGLATMGFALPAAIGAALARPGELVLALTGDGGLSLCLGELETVARLGLPITVIVFNDERLSLIAIKQTAHHGGDAATRYRLMDFAAIARACGIEGTIVHSAAELDAALASRADRPRLIDARIDPSTYPALIAATRG